MRNRINWLKNVLLNKFNTKIKIQLKIQIRIKMILFQAQDIPLIKKVWIIST
jgi:hypothetical protein